MERGKRVIFLDLIHISHGSGSGRFLQLTSFLFHAPAGKNNVSSWLSERKDERGRVPTQAVRRRYGPILGYNKTFPKAPATERGHPGMGWLS